MTSSKCRTGPNRRAGAAPIAVLTLDALHEIFLRLPGKDLCRVRAVCRSWRSLLADPGLAAAHAARHPEPLIIAGYDELDNNGVVFSIVDLAGRVIRRVKGAAAAAFERVMSLHLDLVCVAEGASGPCRVFSPGGARASSWTLPEGMAAEHAVYEAFFSHRRTTIVLGQVESTGWFKVFRMFDGSPIRKVQVYEVLTLAAGGRTSRWRGKEAPPYAVSLGSWSSVVVSGFVYFFSNETGRQEEDSTAFRVGSFDLETEEWRPKIPGPLRSVFSDSRYSWRELELVVLGGCLVVVHRMGCNFNLWCLKDRDKGIWVMRNTIQAGMEVRPLLVLNDGRMVLVHKGSKSSLKIFNPETDTSTYIAEIGPCNAIGVYTGNILSLANGARSS
ncbi:hypothetical protein QOZ80_7BG0591160 [Eleusine coracana subsp. coracana]|nr:hypothetical protein QOZ80_7BG0591160 [Eleusine coracana subsp. coracana]